MPQRRGRGERMSVRDDDVVALPSRVRVCGFDFDIVAYRRMEAVGAQKWGEFSSAELTIRIDPCARPQKVVDTMLHEILHAMMWVYDLNAIKDDEERVCSVLATAWLAFFRDNPTVVDWIVGITREGVTR